MKEKVIDLLEETFNDNPASIEVPKQDDKLKFRFRKLLEYSFFYSNSFGKIYFNSIGDGCALIVDSEKKGFSLGLLRWYYILATQVVGITRSLKILNRMKVLSSARPKDSHIYIWYIGVRRVSRRKGIGSDLMQKIFNDHPNRLICLETTKPENLPFYERLGFKIEKQTIIGKHNFKLLIKTPPNV